MKLRYLLFIALVVPMSAGAQRDDRDYVRKGNKSFSDSLYVKAEENYLKALDKNSGSTEASYNLANAYLYQQKGQEAAEQYVKAATAMELERDRLLDSGKASAKEIKVAKDRTAQAYHNLGVVMQAAQDYAKAVAAYQQALRNNPTDDETRYNLALAMHQLKEQQNQQEQNQDQQDQNQQQEQEQQQNQQDQQQNQQQDQQQNQQQNQDQQEQNQQPQPQNKEDMSRENAEQLLQAAMQDEKDVQQRVQQMMQAQSKGKLEKDW